MKKVYYIKKIKDMITIKEVEPHYEILPRLIIFSSLGGYTAEKEGKESLRQSALIENDLSRYMQVNNLIIDIDIKGRLVFTKKPV